MTVVAEKKLLGTYVHGHHDLIDITMLNQESDILGAHLIGRVAVSLITDVVNAHIDSSHGNGK